MVFILNLKVSHPWHTADLNADPGGEWIWLIFTVSGLSTFSTEEMVCYML